MNGRRRLEIRPTTSIEVIEKYRLTQLSAVRAPRLDFASFFECVSSSAHREAAEKRKSLSGSMPENGKQTETWHNWEETFLEMLLTLL